MLLMDDLVSFAGDLKGLNSAFAWINLKLEN